jgi:catechol 2,3-dioxygenase-like lactoylglutathione lyase family enzyme
MFLALDHPCIACLDVRRQVEWYCAALGMRVIATDGKEPPGFLVGYGQTTKGAAMIELVPAKDPGPRPDAFARSQPGLRHVALRVRDFDAAHARLKSLGVSFTAEPGEALGGGRTVLFRDPEGNELQIVERMAPEERTAREPARTERQ